MDNFKKMGRILYDGSVLNISDMSIEELNKKVEKILLDEIKIKNEIYEVIENF